MSLLHLPAAATIAAAESAAREGDYRELIEQAVTEYRMGNWPEARSLFERAHEVQPSARTLRGIGLSAFEERNYVAAIQYLKAAVADERKPLTDNQRDHANQVIDRALGYIAQYELDLQPPEAEVLVDARPPVIVEDTLLLNPGTHELVVSIEGHEEERRRIKAQPNERLVLRIQLAPVGGKQVAEGDADENEAQEDARDEDARTRRMRIAGYTVGSAGAAGLVASLALTLKARSLRDASGCESNRCPDGSFAEYNRAMGFAKASTAAAVLGGAALATGVTLLVWPRFADEEEPPEGDASAASARLIPAASPWFTGLTLAGEWR